MACCLPRLHRGRTWGYKPEGERFSALNLGMVSPARLTLTESFLKNLMQAAKTRTVRYRLFVLSNTRPCSSMQATAALAGRRGGPVSRSRSPRFEMRNSMDRSR